MAEKTLFLLLAGWSRLRKQIAPLIGREDESPFWLAEKPDLLSD